MTPPHYDAARPDAYVGHVLSLVAGRDPLPLLADAPARIAAAVDGLSDADARRPEPKAGDSQRPGGWSVLGVLRHLADSEVVYGYRLRLIVAADRPAIPGYDQDAWASRLAYDRGTVEEALADYASGRRMTLSFLHALGADAWDRAGLHSERGEESVRRIVTLLAGHDLNHEAQIRRVRAALGA